LHSKLGSGHLAHAGHGGHFSVRGQADDVGHAGHTGGTTSDFKMYKSSWPGGIMRAGIPVGNELLYWPLEFALALEEEEEEE